MRNLESVREQLKQVEEDLIKNKDAGRLKNLGLEMDLNLAKDICPTCYQEIKDSLLPKQIEQIPMNIDDNIQFLQSQKNMMQLSISANEETLLKKQDLMQHYRTEINELRKNIRILKRERISDATLLLAKGVNVKVISERLGHSNIKITLDTYSHVLPTMQEDAVNKIEEIL